MAILKGWGGHPQITGNLAAPFSTKIFRNNLTNEIIARGMGRSYGDSAIAKEVLLTSYLDHFISFDKDSGILTCESGVTIRELLELVVPAGWFVGVTPGTSYVTLGGAIASDVHGKNHHITGTFCNFVESITLLLGTGEIVCTSPLEKPDLFFSTCGGMGLTGIILSATIRLIPIRSSSIIQRTLKANCLEDACDQFEKHQSSNYIVAWIDCMKKGKSLGRSLLILGEHDSQCDEKHFKNREPINIPNYIPSYLLNRTSVSTFNSLYYSIASNNKEKNVHIQCYFYPLDLIGGWNRLYGKSGFIQYQFVLPQENGIKNMRTILAKIVNSDIGSFLGVLKKFGKQNKNLLSFPIEGYTLAVDIKLENKALEVISKLDSIIIDMGGKIYLTKDALMSEGTFKKTYPNWRTFEDVRAKYGAVGHFASSQSKRLGLQ